MRKVLTFEEQREKALAEAAERKKRSKPPRERKSAYVTGYRKFTEIASQAVYRSAHLDPKGYNEYLPPDLTATEIGGHARTALLASRFITPEHPEWDDVIRIPTKEEFRAWEDADKIRAGVKTLKALFNGAGHVSLKLWDSKIAIKPTRYRGRGHWEGIRGLADTVLPEVVSDEAFGKAILDALDISRNA